jgi:hypothetical protein
MFGRADDSGSDEEQAGSNPAKQIRDRAILGMILILPL